jgi:hypothetical protein
MKDRGELGCALVLLALLAAGVIYVLSQAAWLLIAAPIALVIAIVALLVLADVTSDDVLMASEEPGGFTAWRVSTLNNIRRALNKPPLYQVPKNGVTFEERQLVKQAARVAGEIASALRNSRAPVSDRDQIRMQAGDVPANMAQALWRLDRVRRTARALDPRSEQTRATREEIAGVERQILDEMQRALATLSTIPVNLVKLEMAQADRPAERLLGELNETNQQLRDVSAAYKEMRGGQAQ